jgi:type II secretory pathway component PulM
MLDKLRQWFAARSAGEQRTLRLGGIAALIVLLIAALVPLQRSVSAASARVATLRSDMAWLRSVSPQLAAAASMPAATGESLVVIADRAARAAGIAGALTSSQPAANGGLDVRLDRVAFDALATWLGQLAQRHGVQVESATVEGAGAPGLVSASLVLRQR